MSWTPYSRILQDLNFFLPPIQTHFSLTQIYGLFNKAPVVIKSPSIFMKLQLLFSFSGQSRRMPTAEERVAIVSVQLCGLSYKQEWQEFMQKFRKPSPRTNIQTLTNKFCGRGWVTDEEHSDRPPRTENSVQHIQHVICTFVVTSKGITVKYGLKMEPTNGTGTHHKCRYN